MSDIKQITNKILEGDSVRSALNESGFSTVKLRVYPKYGWGSYVVTIDVPRTWESIDDFICSWVDDNLANFDRWEFIDMGIWKK